MPEPELHVQQITKTAAACESGRHLVHPFLECDEIDLLSAAFMEMIESACADAFTAADQLTIVSNSTAEPIPVFGGPERAEPSPVERALAILDPHLRACPLYRKA
ncbi:hypothetical protein ACWDE0_21965 [Streptomyces sp. 900105755]